MVVVDLDATVTELSDPLNVSRADVSRESEDELPLVTGELVVDPGATVTELDDCAPEVCRLELEDPVTVTMTAVVG